MKNHLAALALAFVLGCGPTYAPSGGASGPGGTPPSGTPGTTGPVQKPRPNVEEEVIVGVDGGVISPDAGFGF